MTAVLSGERKNGLLLGNGLPSGVAAFREVDLVTDGGRDARVIAGAEYVGDRRPPSLLSSSAPAAEWDRGYAALPAPPIPPGFWESERRKGFEDRDVRDAVSSLETRRPPDVAPSGGAVCELLP